DHKAAFRSLAITLAMFACVAGLWMLVLSNKYGKPTFSTTARIAHALAGPGVGDRYHPTFRTFHEPESGRVTSWEDPTSMPYQLIVRIAAVPFGLLAIFWCLVALRGLPNPASEAALDLAAKLGAAKIAGPVVGSALMPGGRAGLYTAFFLKQPWQGDQLDPTV